VLPVGFSSVNRRRPRWELPRLSRCQRRWLMKILLSAYACEPGKGSEPEVGLRTMLAAASEHEVWVLTRSNNIEALEGFLSGRSDSDRVHLVGIEAARAALWLKSTHVLPVQVYYHLWQRAAERRARLLEAQVAFDIVHHITFASYWARTGVAAVDVPMVWGPVGGAVRTPRGFGRLLGLRGLVAEFFRSVVRALAWRWNKQMRSRSVGTLVLAQNPDTATRLSTVGDVRVVTNATAVELPQTDSHGPRSRDVVCAGRLIPWKAGVLAIRTMQAVQDPTAVLVFYGDGPEAKRIERLAKELAVRIRLEGNVDREELLDAVGRASVLLHTALHEEAGLVVAEALSLGTPVVCLDHGGPGELVRAWPSVPSVAVAPESIDGAVKGLADGIRSFLAEEIAGDPAEPRPAFDKQILAAYRDVLG